MHTAETRQQRRHKARQDSKGIAKAHQSGQECLRRAVGGWGWRKRFTGLTKSQTLKALTPHGRIPLERAIELVRGMEAA